MTGAINSAFAVTKVMCRIAELLLARESASSKSVLVMKDVLKKIMLCVCVYLWLLRHQTHHG
jgi:hypothetical protein